MSITSWIAGESKQWWITALIAARWSSKYLIRLLYKSLPIKLAPRIGGKFVVRQSLYLLRSTYQHEPYHAEHESWPTLNSIDQFEFYCSYNNCTPLCWKMERWHSVCFNIEQWLGSARERYGIHTCIGSWIWYESDLPPDDCRSDWYHPLETSR